MGWAGGSELFYNVWNLIRDQIPEKGKKKTIKKLICFFEDQDCDTISDLFDDFPEVEKVYREIHPEEFEDEEDEEC